MMLLPLQRAVHHPIAQLAENLLPLLLGSDWVSDPNGVQAVG